VLDTQPPSHLVVVRRRLGVEVLARSVLEYLLGYLQSSPKALPIYSENMVTAKYIGE